MNVNRLIEQIKKVHAGQGDFAALLDRIHSQTIVKQKVVSLDAVKKVRSLNKTINQIT